VANVISSTIEGGRKKVATLMHLDR